MDFVAPHVTLEDIPANRYTEATIAKMHELVKQAKTDWQFVQLATWIVSSCPAKDHYEETKRILEWSKAIIRYVRDPFQVELVETVWDIFQRRATDCDGFSILIGSLGGAIGYPYRFVTVKANPQAPDEWSHVYPMLETKYGWVALDAIVPESTVGWEPKTVIARKDWDEPTY
jgi:hypothetical protein